MNPNTFDVLDLCRLEFRLCACEPTRLPGFLGSTLRGAFGHAFKRVACLMDEPACRRGCQAIEQCGYGYIFETGIPAHLSATGYSEDLPHPYLILPPEVNPQHPSRYFNPGDELTFGLVLIGSATTFHHPVTLAVQIMGQEGLGVQRAVFELVEVLPSNPAALNLGELIHRRLMAMEVGTRLTIRCETPTRIRYAKDLQVRISFPVLVRNLARRLNALTAVHGRGPLNFDVEGLTQLAAQVVTTADRSEWCDWERFSNRQQTKMKLGGVIGEMEYSGEAIAGFLPLLAAGEVVHVGTATSFGLGRFKIES